MEKSLVLIKPDGVEQNIIGKIISMYEEAGLKVVGLKMMTINKKFAMKHYKEHIGKPFFDELINYITRGPLCALILEGDNAVNKIRRINGATNPSKAEKGSIRALYGKNLTENCVHASDSVENAKSEIELWFK